MTRCWQVVLRSDWLTLWNVNDLLSIVLLLTAATDYLLDHARLTRPHSAVHVLQNAGSVGVAVKWLGLLGYLDSFQYFSKTLKVRLNSWTSCTRS